MSDDTLPLFVHSELDEAGLDPYEFRLYARYVRRAGTDGVCYEAHSSMADDLKMDERTLRDARDGLEHRGMIDVESRPGTTDIVTPLPVESWDTDASAQTVTSETAPKNGTAHKNDTALIYERGTTYINAPAPAPEMGEGTLRFSRKVTPLEGQVVCVCVGEEERDGEMGQDEDPTQPHRGDTLPAEATPPVADTHDTPDDEHQTADGAGTGDDSADLWRRVTGTSLSADERTKVIGAMYRRAELDWSLFERVLRERWQNVDTQPEEFDGVKVAEEYSWRRIWREITGEGPPLQTCEHLRRIFHTGRSTLKFEPEVFAEKLEDAYHSVGERASSINIGYLRDDYRSRLGTYDATEPEGKDREPDPDLPPRETVQYGYSPGKTT